MNTYEVSQLKANSFYNDEITLDSLFLLTYPPCPVTQEQINALKEWNFEEVYSDGKTSIIKNLQGKSSLNASPEEILRRQKEALASLGENESVSLSDFIEVDEEEEERKRRKELQEELKRKEEEEKKFKIEKPSIGNAFLNTTNEDEKIKIAQTVYDEYMKYIDKVYTRYATHNELNLPDLNESVLELCNFIRENTKFILRVQPSLEIRNNNFLVSHSMRSTVLAIAIALQLKMPLEKMVELGVTSILHEIGQIKLPPQLYIKEKKLSPSEYAQMCTHPIIGYNIVKSAGFPLTIQLGILEHHERETGIGYPRHLTGDKISLYAKIIAVVCSYEAITAPRTFKDARTTYEAMIEMLKNENHQYDAIVVRALLYCLSLYPIGSYVYLSNGKVAQVIDINPENPKNPIVHIINDKDENGNPKKIQTDENHIKIVRAMNKKEAEDILKAL